MDVTKRICWVDYYKTFSIFLIVLGHSFINHKELIHFIYLFHVPLFFFASGYLEKREQCNSFEYIKKLISRLVLPYFLWNFLCVFFHMPMTADKVCAMLLGQFRWNGASWFLGVLAIIKLLALFLKNRKWKSAAAFAAALLAMFASREKLPYSANLAFMFLPFFLLGMFGKKAVDAAVRKFEGRKAVNMALSSSGIALLLAIYCLSDIPHTNAVSNFTSKFYWYWISGAVGIATMFFLSICFNNVRSAFVETVSTATLFIMCSHYEVLKLVTKPLSANYGDTYGILFTVAYFAVQCACAPLVLKYIPMLAGRKK